MPRTAASPFTQLLSSAKLKLKVWEQNRVLSASVSASLFPVVSGGVKAPLCYKGLVRSIECRRVIIHIICRTGVVSRSLSVTFTGDAGSGCNQSLSVLQRKKPLELENGKPRVDCNQSSAVLHGARL